MVRNILVKINLITCSAGSLMSWRLRVFLLTARWYGELPSVSGLVSFLPVQVDGTELARHDKVVKMAKSRLTGRRFLVKVCYISGKAKNADSCASAGSPIDFVSIAGVVTVPKV